MNVTAFDIAQRFVGVRELPGKADNPFILSMLRLDEGWPGDEEVPWCSAFANYVAWLLRLPRTKALNARSWLGVGLAVPLEAATVGFDVVVLQRGAGVQPGPDVTNASGHVGFFAGRDVGKVMVLGGNQGNAVSVAAFDEGRVLGVRRLA